jgi:DNA invertase Pin-like site-specific DNA recombinase
MATVGYARVSSASQCLDRQIDDLTKAGVTDDHLFTEKMTGTRADRPEWEKCCRYLRRGDVLVIESLSQVGRNMMRMLQVLGELEDKGVQVRSLKENVDTTTATGKLIVHIMAALSEFERDLMEERTSAGRDAAKARGRSGGRPATVTAAQVAQARERMAAGESLKEAAAALEVGRMALYRALERHPVLA